MNKRVSVLKASILRTLKKSAVFFLVFALLISTIPFLNVSAAEMNGTESISATMTDTESAQIIKDRIKAKFIKDDAYRVVSGSDIFGYISKSMEYANSIEPNGSWSDVNYSDHTNSANGTLWSPYYALYRITAMAMGYNQEGNEAYQNPVIKDAIERALTYWDSVKPSSTNWWENEVGQAMCMGVTGIFMEGSISKEALDVCVNYNRGRLDTVGANGVWRTQDYLYKMLVRNNYTEITKGISTLAKTLAVDETGTSTEAVQSDSSFYCHGAKLYSEGYGMAQFNMVATWVGYTSGTNFAFSEEGLEGIDFYILDGTRWMIRGEFGFLYLGYRRYNTIEGVGSYAADILPGMIAMAQSDTDPVRSAKYQQLVDNIEGKSVTNGLVGNKHFWRTDYSSHMRDNFGIMTKMSSSRINGGEYRSHFRKDIGNEIYWNAAGTTAIFVNGREYTDLVPAFDWSHYPGTTASYEKMPYSLECKFNANSSFVGGVSNGMYGASVFTQNMNSTVARKGYFYFDDEMVALGAGISSTRPAEVHTTINQAIAKDNASVDGVTLSKGTAPVTYTNPKWAYNDQIGYVFPANSEVSVSNIDQTSSWPDQPEQTKQAFSLYLNHGINPNNASYQYIVVPGKAAAEVEAYSQNIPVKILSNTTDIQAVRNEGIKQTQMIFYNAGSFEYRTDATITVNQPCLVIVDESSGTPKVTVSNPDIPGLVVDVKIEQTSSATLYGRYNLGSGIYMGQSLTQTLSDVPLTANNIKASSFLPGFAPLNAVDDSMESSWRSEPDESQNITYNIETPNSYVDKVTIDWGDNYAKEYIVQYSIDNVNWTDGCLQWDGSGGQEVINLPYVKANHIRILLLSSNNKTGYEIKDLQVNNYVNRALRKTSSASGTDSGRAASNAVDSDESTRFSANNSASAWWQVDLGQKTSVRTIRISWESTYATSYKIQKSDNGTDWTDVNSYTCTKPGWQVLDIPDGIITESRYIRLQCVSRVGTSYGMSFYELEVFSEPSIPTPLPNYGGRTNLAYGKTVTMDSSWNGTVSIETPYTTDVPTDGNMGTKSSTGRGTSGLTERSFYLDLGQPSLINEVKLFWEANMTGLKLEYSNDLAGPWTLIPDPNIERSTYNVAKNNLDDVKFKPLTARYIRASGVMATKYGLAIYELEVYGDYSYKLDNHAVTLNKGDTLDLKALISPYSETDSVDFKSYNTNAVTVGAPITNGDSVVGGQGTYTTMMSAISGGTSVIIVRHSAGSEYDLCTVKVNTYKSDLQALYDVASLFDQNDYISSSWTDSNIDNALINANTALSDDAATQRQVDAALQNLQTSMNTLEKKTNKASLVTVTSQIKALKQSDYTPESWENANFERLLTDANSVYFNDYATQQEVDSIVNALISAMNGLVKVTNPGNPSIITLDSTSKLVYKGQDFTITATVTTSAAIDNMVLFSSDSDAVIVGETEYSTPSGITTVHLNAAKVGNAVITATTTDGGIAICAVTVSSNPTTTGPTEPKPQPIEPKPEPGIVVTTKPVIVDGAAKVEIEQTKLRQAFDTAPMDANGDKTAVINIEKMEGQTSYVATLPANSLTEGTSSQKIKIVTDIGTVILPTNMLQTEGVNVKNVDIKVTKADTTNLKEKEKTEIGDRPITNISVMADGNKIQQSNPDAKITVSIPYQPTADEKADLEHIVILSIDSEGKATPVPTGKYDTATGLVSFTTISTGTYAVAYVEKSFNDMDNYAWAQKAVEVMASKGVISGTSETSFTPKAAIKRGDFMILLVKALGLSAKTDANFSDVDTTSYYYNAIAVTKKLGIAAGKGNNIFDPEAAISRQEMMILMDKAMKLAGKMLESGIDSDLDRFADNGKIASFAKDSVKAMVKCGIVAGDGDMINPTGNATRAETAVMIYKLYNK